MMKTTFLDIFETEGNPAGDIASAGLGKGEDGACGG